MDKDNNRSKLGLFWPTKIIYLLLISFFPCYRIWDPIQPWSICDEFGNRGNENIKNSNFQGNSKSPPFLCIIIFKYTIYLLYFSFFFILSLDVPYIYCILEFINNIFVIDFQLNLSTSIYLCSCHIYPWLVLNLFSLYYIYIYLIILKIYKTYKKIFFSLLFCSMNCRLITVWIQT